MRVRELIEALQECDPELAVAYPVQNREGEYRPMVVVQVVTSTDVSISTGEFHPCIVLNPTFEHLDRMPRSTRTLPPRPERIDFAAVIKEAGFEVKKNLAHPFLGPTSEDRHTLWCKECGRDSGFHWNDCSKIKKQLERRDERVEANSERGADATAKGEGTQKATERKTTDNRGRGSYGQ